jgi:hypothetical protein
MDMEEKRKQAPHQQQVGTRLAMGDKCLSEQADKSEGRGFAPLPRKDYLISSARLAESCKLASASSMLSVSAMMPEAFRRRMLDR